MQLQFTKMHGLGNDFVVIDATRHAFEPNPALLARLTDRRFGIGCDQVLVVDRSPAPEIDFGYRIYNADGSQVGQCGNGARCLARYVADRGLTRRHTVRVQTTTSILELHLLSDGQVRVDMGPPRFEPIDVPLRAPLRQLRYDIPLPEGGQISVGAASMGNPHALIEVADIETAPVDTVGAALQHSTAFPERVNVGFIEYVDATHAKLRVYERGAAETPACGSGACAAMAISQIWGRLGARAELAMRYGTLLLEWAGEGSSVYMTGPAETVFEGSIEWPN
jgi:diaminopimelate epimerase